MRQHHAFRFAGGAAGVDDGREIAAHHGRALVRSCGRGQPIGKRDQARLGGVKHRLHRHDALNREQFFAHSFQALPVLLTADHEYLDVGITQNKRDVVGAIIDE